MKNKFIRPIITKLNIVQTLNVIKDAGGAITVNFRNGFNRLVRIRVAIIDAFEVTFVCGIFVRLVLHVWILKSLFVIQYKNRKKIIPVLSQRYYVVQPQSLFDDPV